MDRDGTSCSQVLAETNVRVTDICDIDPHGRDKALSTAAQHKPRSLSEWRRLLDYRDVDAVIIATPCDLHAEMAAACLDAGKYVYCEKPLGEISEGHLLSEALYIDGAGSESKRD